MVATSTSTRRAASHRERATRVREDAAAALCLGLLTLALFAPLTRHPTDLLVGVQRDGRNDVTAHSLAARDFLRQTLIAKGETPAWMDTGLLGSPWLGNPQSAMFYPPHWLFLVVETAYAISWMIVAHHLWAGLGVYLLVRSLGGVWSAGVVAGVCFAGAPFLVAQTGEGHSTQVFLVAWTPWAVLAYERLRRAAPAARSSLAAVFAIAFFCGHVQEVYYLVVILSGFLACDLIWRDHDSAPRLRLLTAWCQVGLLTAGLVMIELLPNWIYTRFAVRSQGIDAASAGQISAGFANLRQLIDPFALGGPSDYSGPGLYYWETLCCFGLAPLAFALVGATTLGGRRRAWRWLALAALTMLFALGNDTPLFALMHRYVPGMSLFRAPGRALFFTSLSVAVLAGLGWDSIIRRLTLSNSNHEPAAGKRPVAFVLAATAILICGGELSWYVAHLCATAPQATLRRDSMLLEQLQTTPNRGRVLVPQELLSDREALAGGVEKLRRYEPVPLARTFALFTALAPEGQTGDELTGFFPLDVSGYDKRLLDMLNVTHLVLATSSPPDLDGWSLIGRGRIDEEIVLRGQTPRTIPYAIYRNHSPQPRAFVVREAVVATTPSPAGLSRIDPRRQVLLDARFADAATPAAPDSPEADASSSFDDDIKVDDENEDEVKIIQQDRHRVRLEARLAEDGYVVLSDAHYPGWRCESEHPLMAANLALRAVRAPAGEHEITLSYTPPGSRIGTLVSSLCWLLVVAVLATTGRQRWSRLEQGQGGDG